MAVSLNKFVITSTVTVPAGPASAADARGTCSHGSDATHYGSVSGAGTTFIKGSSILLDSGTPSALYSVLSGLGVLRAHGNADAVGREALAN